MIMTVQEVRDYVNTTETDQGVAVRLRSLETLIRKYTNNTFQARNFRTECNIEGGKLRFASGLFAVGDTVQISESDYNEGLYTITNISGSLVEVDGRLYDEKAVLVTKVVYPDDVKMGVVNMLKWDLENRDKVGITSETISRHSVTYESMNGENAIIGYPKSLVGFLKPYIKARF